MTELTKYDVSLERETSEGGDGLWTATSKNLQGRGFTPAHALNDMLDMEDTPQEEATNV